MGEAGRETAAMSVRGALVTPGACYLFTPTSELGRAWERGLGAGHRLGRGAWELGRAWESGLGAGHRLGERGRVETADESLTKES